MPQQNIEVGLRFTADTSNASRQVAKLKDDISKAIQNASIMGKDGKPLEGYVQQAAQFRGILEAATNEAGKLDLTKLQRGLSQSGLSMKQVHSALQAIGAENAFGKLTNQIMQANTRSQVLHGTLQKFATGLKNTAMWTIQSNAIHAVQSALQGAFSYAQKLNKGLTDIAIVSDLNADQLAAFAKSANAAAKELSTTTNEYVKGALIYYQQGLNDKEVAERTETTIKMANASGESAETISSYMTAIWNNFDHGAESVEHYADVIAYLGATTAASNAQIAEGMQAFAATAETVGLSYEYSAAALTTLVDRTQQSASKIGTSLKTIFARLSSVSLGETLEDDVNLTKYTKALEKVGVDVLDATGNLKSMNSILDELGAKWETLNQAQKVAVAQTVGGVRQYNNLISLLDNYDYFKELVTESKAADGYLQTQQEKYADSWEGANKRIKASWETLYSQIINDDFFIKLANVTADIINAITKIVDGVGGMKGIIAGIIAMVATIRPEGLKAKIDQLVESIRALADELSGVQQQRNIGVQTDAFLEQIGQKANSGEIAEQYERLKPIISQINELKATGNKDDLAKAQELTELVQRRINLLDTANAEQRKVNDAVNQIFDTDNEALRGTQKEKEDKEFNFQDELERLNGVGKYAPKGALSVKGMFGVDKSVWQDFAKVGTEEAEKAGEQIKQALIDGLKNADTTQAMQDELTMTMSGFESKIAELKAKLETEGQKLGEEERQQIQEEIDNYIHLKEQLEDLLQKMSTAKGSSEQVAGIINNLRDSGDLGKDMERKPTEFAKYTQAFAQLGSSVTLTTSSIDGFYKSLKSGNGDIRSYIGSLTGIASGLGMAAGSMKNLGITLGQIDKTTGASTGVLPKWLFGPGGAILLIAAIEIITLVAKAIDKAVETNAEKSERLARAVADTTAAAKEAKTAYEDLKTTLDSLDGAHKNINKMTMGTQEWRDAIDAANESALDLISTYGDLKQGVDWAIDSNGLIRFSERGKEKAMDYARQQVEDAQLAMFAARQAQGNFISQQTEKEMAKTVSKDANLRYEATEKEKAESGGTYTGAPTELGNQVNGIIEAVKDGSLQISDSGKIFGDAINDFDADTIKYIEGNSNLIEQLRTNADAINTNTAALEASRQSDFARMMSESNGEAWNDLSEEERAALENQYSDYVEQATENWKQQNTPQGLSQAQLEEYWEASGHSIDRSSGTPKYFYGTDFNTAVDEDFNINNIRDEAFEYYALQAGEREGKAYAEGFLNKSKEALEADAENYQEESGWQKNYTLDELEEGAKNFTPQEQAEDTETQTQYLQYLNEEYDNTVDHLENLEKEYGKNSEEVEEYQEKLKNISHANTRFNEGLDDIINNFDDYVDTLENADKGTQEYGKVVASLKDDYDKILDMDTSDLSDGFITNAENLELMRQAAEGNVDALMQLRENATIDIVTHLQDENGNPLNSDSILSQLDGLMDAVPDLEVGATLDDTGFTDALNTMLTNGDLTVAQLSDILNSLGFEPEVTYKEVPAQSVDWEKTEAYMQDPVTGAMTRITGQAQMEQQSTVWIPQIKGSTTAYRGKPSQISSHRPSGGKGGGGGGGGGGGSKPKEAKKAERYHEITDKLDQQAKKLKEITTYEDRAYGKERQQYVQEHIKALEREAELYGQLAEEAYNYLKQDKSDLSAYGAQFNDDGTIKNYDEWYNKWAKTLKDDEEGLKKFEEAIKNYEDSLDKYIDAKQSQLEKLNEAYDTQLKNINDTLKEQNDLIQDNLDLLEYMLNRLNDDGSDAADTIAILNNELTQMSQKAEHYEQAITDLLKNAGASAKDITGFLNGTISIDTLANKLNLTPEAIANLREYAKSLLEINEEMYEMREKAIDQLSKALDKFAEEADKAARKVDFYANNLNHLKNVIDVIGKDALGITNEILEGLADAAYQTALREIDIARTTLEEIEHDRQVFAEQFANGLMTEDEYNEMMDKLDERWMSAVENLAQKEEEALEAATQVFQTHLTNIVEGFEKAMSGPYKTLDHLQDAFEKQKKLNDLYVDDYQKIHDLSKLGRDIQKSMDATDNVKAMEYLKELQDEVNDGLREGNKLTEYNIEFLEKKYQLRLAEIALEEAQNAKNQVRMTRTSEGDWSYTYYADEEATANAQQNYEDKLFELEKLNQEYAKSVQDLIMDNMIQYRDEIANLNLTDAERTALLQQYYEQLQQQYGVFLDTALTDAQWIEGEFNVVDHNLINDWDETTLAAVTNFETLEAMQDAFVTASNTMVTDLNSVYKQWELNWKEVLDTAGDDVNNYAGQVEAASESAIQSGQDVVDAYEQQVKDQETKVWELALTNLDNFLKKWKKKIDEQISKNTELVASIDSLIAKYSQLATAAESSATRAVQAAARAQAAAQAAAAAANSAGGGGGGGGSGGGGGGSTGGGNNNNNNSGGGNHGVRSGTTTIKSGFPTLAAAENWAANYQRTHPNVVLSVFDTGGYTGKWGNGGKLAMLHEKELVLNKTDTTNILNTVEAVRDIASQLSANASISAAGLGELTSAAIGAGTQFEQIVNITAEFPDAVYHDEIKQAFDNLLGRTTQYLMRK